MKISKYKGLYTLTETKNGKTIYINGTKYTIEDLRAGYETITGISPNDDIYGEPLTDQQIIEYMAKELERE